jgi:hypothetical protein
MVPGDACPNNGLDQRQLAALSGVGKRVGESTFGLIPGYPWTSPYEDITLKR